MRILHSEATSVGRPRLRPRKGAQPRLYARATLGLALVLLLTAAAAAKTPVTFRYDAPAGTRSVHLAGSFNGWSSTKTPMQNRGGVWVRTLELEDGVHHYKFIVNGQDWVNDPDSMTEFEASDGHGGMNSAVFVGLDGRDLPEPRENHVRLEAVGHDPDEHASAFEIGRVLLTLRTQASDVDAARAEVLTGGEAEEIPLQRVSRRLGYDYYKAVADTAGPVIRYRFVLTDGDAEHVIDDTGVPFRAPAVPGFTTPTWTHHAVWYQIFTERFRNGDPSNDPQRPGVNLLPWTSDWWDTHTDHGEAAGAENFYTGHGNVWRRRYGGDLQGVKEKLPYLRKLGVNAIYFNPLFEGESMHKYDASDYRHVDDNFGVRGDLPVEGEGDAPHRWKWSESDRVFLDFIEAAHDQGFKVVIDGVFNHVGTDHYAFQDVLENGKRSKYADWFAITDWGRPRNWGDPETYGKPGGIQWEAWDQPNGALPAFRKDDELGLAPGPRGHVFAITRRWMDPNQDGDPSDGIDGWRLDVPQDIPHPFWRDWRELVKSINPDAYITGEIWSLAHPWLEGDQFDAVMNYQFAMLGLDFFADARTADAPSEFLRRAAELTYTYEPQVAFAMQNLYNSHDTDRLASMFVNPDRNYDQANRLQDTGPGYDPRKPDETERRRQAQAVVFQMTYLGAPMVYYGDEAGMWSPDDPSDRMPMWWEDLEPYEGEGAYFHEDVFAHYQRMIAARHALEPLRRGMFRPVMADDEEGIAAFARDSEAGSVTVVFNRSGRERAVSVPVASQRVIDASSPAATDVVFDADSPDARPRLALRAGAPVMTAADGRVELTLEPFGWAVLADPASIPASP